MASTYNLEGLKDGKPLAREEGGRGPSATALYRHPNGQEAIVQYDPLFGNAQANAFERLGYEFVREAKPEEIKTIPELVSAEQKKTGGDVSALTALTASVVEQNKLLGEELNKQREERNARPQDATDISGERARQSAADQASVRTQAHGEVAVTESGDMIKSDGLTPKQLAKAVDDDPNAGEAKEAPEHVGFGAPDEPEAPAEDAKPLSKQNRTELEATAAAEGVEVTPELDTNKKLREAIVARQGEAEGSDDQDAPADDEQLPSDAPSDDESDSEESEQE